MYIYTYTYTYVHVCMIENIYAQTCTNALEYINLNLWDFKCMKVHVCLWESMRVHAFFLTPMDPFNAIFLANTHLHTYTFIHPFSRQCILFTHSFLQKKQNHSCTFTHVWAVVINVSEMRKCLSACVYLCDLCVLVCVKYTHVASLHNHIWIPMYQHTPLPLSPGIIGYQNMLDIKKCVQHTENSNPKKSRR